MSQGTAKAPDPEAVTPITISDDMERDLSSLGIEELRAVTERLRDEIRRRTIALASAMHELRTPLAVLDGYLELLHGGKAGELNEKQREIIEDMRANEKRLKSFISDFLTFTAIETKSLQLNLQVNDLNASMYEVCGMWMPRMQKKRIALHYSPEDDLQPIALIFNCGGSSAGRGTPAEGGRSSTPL